MSEQKSKNLKLTITLSMEDDVIWRVTRALKDKAAFRMGLPEYEVVLDVAEKKLYDEIAAQKRKKLVENA